MYEFAMVTVYWLITCIVVAGVCCREFLFFRPLLPWRLPANATNHSGLRCPENTSFFASPGDIAANSLSIEAHPPYELCRSAFLRAVIGAAYGALWGAAGLLISAVENGFSFWVMIVVSSAVMATASQRGVKDAYITYVNQDGFGLVTIRCDQALKYFLPHMTRRNCFLFNDVDSATLVGNDIMLRPRQWRSGTVSSTLRRPGRICQDNWKRWFESFRLSLLDRDYSESLAKLAKNYRLRYPMGLPNTLTSELGVTFFVQSVLGSQENTDRAPVGRIAYCETGLIVENWLPLYDSLHRNDLLSEGLDFMLWSIRSIDRGHEIQRLVDDWQEKHVFSFSPGSIISISAETDHLSFVATEGRRFSFYSDQISDYELLIRLIRSSIWSAGIEVELISQMAADLKELCEAENTSDLTGTIFGSRLPNHRASIWHSAYELELDRYPNVCSDRELRFRKRVFDDCRRAMSHHFRTESDALMKFLDSTRAADDLTQVSGKTQVVMPPEILIDTPLISPPS